MSVKNGQARILSMLNPGVIPDGLIKTSRLLETTKILEAITKSESDGLFSPEILSIFNSVFQSHYFNESGNYDDLKKVYDQIAKKISVVNGFAQDKFFDSPLAMWPMYHFLQMKPGYPL